MVDTKSSLKNVGINVYRIGEKLLVQNYNKLALLMLYKWGLSI